jgi:transcription antitermination factor NusG
MISILKVKKGSRNSAINILKREGLLDSEILIDGINKDLIYLNIDDADKLEKIISKYQFIFKLYMDGKLSIEELINFIDASNKLEESDSTNDGAVVVGSSLAIGKGAFKGMIMTVKSVEGSKILGEVNIFGSLREITLSLSDI